MSRANARSRFDSTMPSHLSTIRNTNWTILTEDGIALLRPDGERARLAYRKVGELLLTLLKSPARTASRAELGAALWPSSPVSAQSSNLRQAIKNLRDAIGVDSVLADRADCSLADSFRCSFDKEGDSAPTWLSGWLVFLEALSRSSPEQFFEAVRANVDLLCDLPAAQLAVAARRAGQGLPEAHALEGWKNFVLGSVSLGDVPAAGNHFLLAAKFAAAAADTVLFSRSAFWLSACQILRGRALQANLLASDALRQMRGRPVSGSSLLTAARATAFLHMGRFAESRELMSEASCAEPSSIFEHDQREALRAFYLATSGYEGEAIDLVESLRSDGRFNSGGRVGILADLARMAVETLAAPWRVIDTIEPRIRALEAGGQQHFALYATEMFASSLARCNHRQEARAKFLQSRETRSRLGIAYSAWDQRRVAPFFVA